jgi:hypothetical protein
MSKRFTPQIVPFGRETLCCLWIANMDCRCLTGERAKPLEYSEAAVLGHAAQIHVRSIIYYHSHLSR